MAKPITFKQPPKVKGQAQIPLYLKVDPLDKQLVKEFADEQSHMSGMKVSMGNVLMTAFYQQWPTIKKKKRELEKEAIHGRKYIDGITRG
jgi:hypothetical protein